MVPNLTQQTMVVNMQMKSLLAPGLHVQLTEMKGSQKITIVLRMIVIQQRRFLPMEEI